MLYFSIATLKFVYDIASACSLYFCHRCYTDFQNSPFLVSLAVQSCQKQTQKNMSTIRRGVACVQRYIHRDCRYHTSYTFPPSLLPPFRSRQQRTARQCTSVQPNHTQNSIRDRCRRVSRMEESKPFFVLAL